MSLPRGMVPCSIPFWETDAHHFSLLCSFLTVLGNCPHWAPGNALEIITHVSVLLRIILMFWGPTRE